jgi:acetyl-CoA synthetase
MSYQDARDQLIHLATNYDRAIQEFEWPTLTGRFNWATDWYDVMARDNDRVALWIVEEDGQERKYSFAELARLSDQVATWFEHRGASKGDRVLVMLGNQVELWIIMLALAKIGAVIMPTTVALQSADLRDRVERGQAAFVVTTIAETGKFDVVPGAYGRIVVDGAVDGWERMNDAFAISAPTSYTARTDATDPLLVYFTSGTTSRPKMVEHTQVSYPVGHLTTMYWLGLRPGDVHLAISSPGWAKHAWSLYFAPWIAEATVFVYNYSRFDASALLDQMRRSGVSTFCAPPTVWRLLIQSDLGSRPARLRQIVAAGEPLNPEVITQVERAWDLTIRDGFGQTETTALIANTPGQPVKAGSMGRPLPGVPVVLVDPVTGHEAHEEGEICLDLSKQPLNLMTGYLGDPERNAAVMADGFYHTGDVASRDVDGYITYIGRTDDVFKSSDYKVSPFELESALVEHPAVVEAAVVPQPDMTRLAVPKAYVVLAESWAPTAETALSLMAHCRDHLAPYLKVRRIEFVEELPKTVSGKIRRAELRERENQDVDTDTVPHGEFRYEDFAELRG